MTTLLRDMTISAMLKELASKSPAPGGGAVAATLAALGAATGLMTLNYSIGRTSHAQHAVLHARAAARLEALRRQLLQAADDDAEAYRALNELWRLPADDPKRQAKLPDAVRRATEVPFGVLRDAVELLHLLDELRGTTNDMLNSDLAIAAVCADAAGRAAAWNVRINLPSIDDRALAGRIDRDVSSLLDEAASLLAQVDEHCRSVAAKAMH